MIFHNHKLLKNCLCFDVFCFVELSPALALLFVMGVKLQLIFPYDWSGEKN